MRAGSRRHHYGDGQPRRRRTFLHYPAGSGGRMNTRRLSPWHSLRLLALTLAALAVLPGCAQLQSVDTVSASDFPVTGLLYYSRALLMADATGRAALLDGAKQAYAEQPDAIATARLALAYGQPGYTGYAPENGWRYAHKALQAEDQ